MVPRGDSTGGGIDGVLVEKLIGVESLVAQQEV